MTVQKTTWNDCRSQLLNYVANQDLPWRPRPTRRRWNRPLSGRLTPAPGRRMSGDPRRRWTTSPRWRHPLNRCRRPSRCRASPVSSSATLSDDKWSWDWTEFSPPARYWTPAELRSDVPVPQLCAFWACGHIPTGRYPSTTWPLHIWESLPSASTDDDTTSLHTHASVLC